MATSFLAMPEDELAQSHDEHSPQCSRGWGARCARSKGPRCRCACGGHNHGNPKARPNGGGEDARQELTPSDELYYVFDESRPSPAAMLEKMREDDSRVIRFERRPRQLLVPSDIDQGDAVVLLDGAPLPRVVVHHSPDGFEFGYGGSGPADLAWNILALVVPVKEAQRFYQDFKWAFIGNAKKGDELPLSRVRDWLAMRYANEHFGGEWEAQ